MHALSAALSLLFLSSCNALSGITTNTRDTHTKSILPAQEVANDRKPILVSRLDQLNQGKEPREICQGCDRPPIQCLCEHLPSTKIKLGTEVICLQHPVEFRRKTISTVPLLKLVLDKCRVIVGRSFDTQLETLIDDACDQGRIPLLLFPGPDAITLEDSDAIDKLRLASQRLFESREVVRDDKTVEVKTDATAGNKYLLIIVDGTWTQAKRMFRYSPVLIKRCQPIQFMGTTDRSIYDSIRKQPESFCLSTLESCARTLKLLEPENELMDEAVEHLHASLRALVKTQMEQERIHLEMNPGSIRNSTKLELKKMRQNELEANVKIAETKTMVSPPELVGLDKARDLGNGYILRSLRGSADAEFVDSRWPYSSSKSLRMIERQVEADNKNATKTDCSCCLGIEIEGDLVACILRHRNGSLGILHVDENHRRRGLGEILLREASRAVGHRKQPLFAYIVDGNNQSEALFSKLGWVKSDQNSKRGTG